MFCINRIFKNPSPAARRAEAHRRDIGDSGQAFGAGEGTARRARADKARADGGTVDGTKAGENELMEETVKGLLNRIADIAIKTTETEKQHGGAEPREESFLKTIVDDWKYDDTGSHIQSSSLATMEKEDFSQCCSGIAAVIVKQDDVNQIWSEIVQSTSTSIKEHQSLLLRFVYKLILNYLSSSNDFASKRDLYIDSCYRDLMQLPIKSGATVYIQGVVLESESFVVSKELSIRQPNKDDLEIEIKGLLSIHDTMPNYSAILELEFIERGINIQRRYERIICSLRLFDVGSVTWIKNTNYTDSFIDHFLMGTLSSGNIHGPFINMKITKEKEERFRLFFQTLESRIPTNFFHNLHDIKDSLSISYDRYCDALLKLDIPEYRIANAIMGLEALFFKSDGEKDELRYRLRIRIGKFLGALGFNALEVQQLIKEAYDVRSLFLHGGILSVEKGRKIDETHGNINSLIRKILDILRISIVVNLMIEKEKNELIALIDDALIDDEKNNDLKALLIDSIQMVRCDT